MWIDNSFVVPSAVVAVRSTRVKKLRGGAVTSTGCEIWLSSGGIISTKLPTTQVITMLGLVTLN